MAHGINIIEISTSEVEKILELNEGHFLDFKAKEIAPIKLSKSLSAFANADGGELYIGISEEKSSNRRYWRGFTKPEDANGHIQLLEQFFPFATEHIYTFLKNSKSNDFVLKIEIHKSRQVREAADKNYYLRRSAQNLPITDDETFNRIKRNKGITSFETEPIAAPKELITNSSAIITFMLEVIPTAEPEAWLKKQLVLVNELPTVAGLVLFADEPQIALPKQSGIKIYRYQSKDTEGSRSTLAFDPISIEGNAYAQIKDAVEKTASIIESVRVNTPNGLENVQYPTDALHEIITNAVLHRDYGIADDIHIRIFDNRVEIWSPGTLPAHITPENILEERFARNAAIVRLINKFPEPPNKDVGEGLNTAFEAMRSMRLKPPEIRQEGGYVKVILKHEPLATPEELILEYLGHNDQIRNRDARDICFIGSENKMKTILQSMVRKGLIEQVPGSTRYTAAYQKVRRHGKS